MAGTRPRSAGQPRDLMQIGEVAERIGLSIRTIRYYEEVDLVVPSARSEGGFRLYVEADVARLAVIKQMKPLGFTLEEMREVLAVLDALRNPSVDGPQRSPAGGARPELVDRLVTFREAAQQRVVALEDELAIARQFADSLQDEIDHHAGSASRRQ